MHAHDHLELVGGGHDRIPVPVGIVDRGQPERLRVLGEGEGGDALGGHPLHLLGRQRRIPHRDQHQRDVPAGGGATPLLDEPVVVVLQALETELTVARLHEQLPAEAGDRREAQRCEDAGAVHVLEASLGVVAAGPHLRVGQWLRAELLLGLADHGAETRAREALAVVDPVLDAVDGLHVRRPVAVLRRDAVDPKARRLEDVVVDRDEPVEVDGVISSDSTLGLVMVLVMQALRSSCA